MKLVVFSDSHGELEHMLDVIELEQPDHVIHLGDYDSDARALEREYPLLPLIMVRGNCDYRSDTPQTLVVPNLGKRLFLCHGHTYGVKTDLLPATYAAMEHGADILLFGHTHVPYLEQYGDLFLMNPGTIGAFGRPTYGVIELSPGQDPVLELRSL